jgi:translation initiation factor IF-2
MIWEVNSLRVHELAKKHNMPSKDMLDLAINMGIEVSSTLSGLKDEDIKKVEEKIKNKDQKTEIKTSTEKKEVNGQNGVKNAVDSEQLKGKKQIENSKEIKKVVNVEAGKEVKVENTGKAGKTESNMADKKENNKIPEKKISAVPEKKDLKPKLKKVDLIPDSEEVVLDKKKVIKPKGEVIVASEEAVVLPVKKHHHDKPKYAAVNHQIVKPVEKKEEKKEEIKVAVIPEEISMKEFAEKIGHNPSEIIKKLFLKGQIFTINSIIGFELAEELALEYDILVEKEAPKEEETYGEMFNLEEEDSEADLTDRAPVITIMGHVDHGKTSLLDAIRKTTVASGEAGGITQKIGAYRVIKNGKKITFIDTPGHEAFTDMRARGAAATDIAILVVAADDGVMPQTIEAISHAKAANVPIIVAVNKIDKPGATPEKVRQELLEYELVPVEWGGSTEFVEVSAKAMMNLDTLLETILITAELLELKANSKKRAKGVVLESRLDPKMGPVADVLIQEGTLRVGDVFVAGESYGKVRAMVDERGQKITSVEPAQPAEIIGFNTVPEAGDIVYVIKNEKQSKKIVEEIQKIKKLKDQQSRRQVTLEDLHTQLENEKIKDLKLIVKADSKGSVEALKESLNKLSNSEVAVNIIHSSAGAVTEGDIKLAEASNAIIIGYNVSPTTKARIEAEREKIEIRIYNVIYHITEDIEKALHGMLEPEYRELYQGRIEIKQLFKVTKIGTIGGSVVVDGKVRKDSKIRLLRNGIIVFEGALGSLKRFTNDAAEVTTGQECGIMIADYNDLKEGDIIEAYTMQEVKRQLEGKR